MIIVTSPRVKPSIAGILPNGQWWAEHPMKRPVENSHQRDGLARKSYELMAALSHRCLLHLRRGNSHILPQSQFCRSERSVTGCPAKKPWPAAQLLHLQHGPKHSSFARLATINSRGSTATTPAEMVMVSFISCSACLLRADRSFWIYD